MGNSGAFVPVFPLLPAVVNREVPEVPPNFRPHSVKPAEISCLNAEKGVTAIARFWAFLSVDRGNPGFAQTGRTKEMSLTTLVLPLGLLDIPYLAYT